MKTNIKALELIEKGMTAKTVSKLTESQVNILHSKLQEQVTTTTKQIKTITVPQDIAKTIGADIGKVNVKTDANGNVIATELGEDDTLNVVQDPDATEDGMGMFEEKSTASSICHSQVGPKKSRKWERCVREIEKQLGEGKNPVSLFLENEIMKIVERNILPRITKGDLIKHLNEEENFATKHLQSFGTKQSPKVKKEVDEQNPSPAPTKKPAPTKPGTKTPPKPRPSHPGKNPNPGEKEAPKAQKTSPEKAKNEIIDVIIKMLEK